MESDNFLANFKNVMSAKLKDGQVIVVKGEWGVGKTTFIKNYLGVSQRRSSVSYVSCFGINTIDDLKGEIAEARRNISAIGELKRLIGTAKKTWIDFEWKKNFFNKQRGKRTWSDTWGIIKKLILWLWQFIYFLISIAFNWFITKLRIIAPVVDGILLNLGSIYRSWSFATVRNCIVCLDDLERKGNEFSIKDILGLVSFLREERSCDVVIIFNDKELPDKDRGLLSKYREKVLGVELLFYMSPKECYKLATPDIAEEYSAILIDYFEKVGCTNIRIISRVKSVIKEISPHEIEGLDNTRVLAVISKEISQAILLYYKKDTSQPNDTDDYLRKILSKYLSEGKLEKEALNEYFTKKTSDLTSLEVREKFQGIWDIWISSLQDNSEAILSLINKALDSIEYWTPSELYTTIFYLETIGGQDPLIKEVVDKYKSTNSLSKQAFAPEDDGFGNKHYPTNSYFLSIAEEYRAENRSTGQFFDAMDFIFEKEGYRAEFDEILQQGQIEEYKDFFLQVNSLNLNSKFGFYVSFIKGKRKILEKSKAALDEIASLSPYQKLHADFFSKQLAVHINQ